MHVVTEAAKLAFADREQFYGDPTFVDVPLAGLLAPAYAERRRALIDLQAASLAQRPGDPRRGDALLVGEEIFAARDWGRGTVYVAAVDDDRTMASFTPSGAWIPTSPVIDGLGFPLGTRIQTFYLDARHPNALLPGSSPARPSPRRSSPATGHRRWCSGRKAATSRTSGRSRSS